jgi:prefoldin subunit 5
VASDITVTKKEYDAMKEQLNAILTRLDSRIKVLEEKAKPKRKSSGAAAKAAA